MSTAADSLTNTSHIRQGSPHVDQSLFFDIEGSRFVAWPDSATHSQEASTPNGGADGTSYVTVISTHDLEGQLISAKGLGQYIEKPLEEDDVFRPEFLEQLFLAGPHAA